MARDCGLFSYQGTLKVETGNKPSHTTKTLIGYTALYFIVIVNLHQPIHEAQIYFVFLSVGNPKTVLKGGYEGWRGGSSLTKLW
jgi:hypothetical protein